MMIKKTFHFALLSLALVVFCGCAAVREPVSTAPQQIERGVRGQGQIVTRNPTSDAFGSDYQ